MDALMEFLRDENGQGMSEYSIVVGVVAIATIAVMIAFRERIGKFFTAIGKGIDKASSEAQKGY